jgi:hypothetical protein
VAQLPNGTLSTAGGGGGSSANTSGQQSGASGQQRHSSGGVRVPLTFLKHGTVPKSKEPKPLLPIGPKGR